jgi:hypothetical protein
VTAVSPGTRARSVRVPDDLWDAALAATAANGETVSDVVRRALAVYVGGVETRAAVAQVIFDAWDKSPGFNPWTKAADAVLDYLWRS